MDNPIDTLGGPAVASAIRTGVSPEEGNLGREGFGETRP